MSEIRKTLKQRFRENTGIDWIWRGTTAPKGYGKIFVDGKLEYAHRVSYKIHIGEIPEGMFVLHSCDNRACVNPEHLHLGTIAENQKEMVDRNRSTKGEKHPMSKLTKQDVIEIRKKYKSGVIQKKLAEEYGVCFQNISVIVNNKRWTNV